MHTLDALELMPLLGKHISIQRDWPTFGKPTGDDSAKEELIDGVVKAITEESDNRTVLHIQESSKNKSQGTTPFDIVKDADVRYYLGIYTDR